MFPGPRAALLRPAAARAPRSVIRAAVDFELKGNGSLLGKVVAREANFIFLVFTLSVNDLLSMCREGGRAGSRGAALGSARPSAGAPRGTQFGAEPPLSQMSFLGAG